MNPLRPLTDDEAQTLKASIEAHGVISPVLVNQDGEIIDGHHRLEIAAALDVECPVERLETTSDAHLLALQLELNLARRQLTEDDRKALHGRLRSEGWSLRSIADMTGYSKNTVNRDTDEGIVPDGTMPARVETSDGRTYPARRPARAVEPGDIVTDDTGDQRLVTDVDNDGPETVIRDAEDDAIILDPDTELETRRYPTKPDVGGGISHPARYSTGMLEIFDRLLDDDHHKILDPFAGVGGIHQLQDHGRATVGVELEPEWANLHPDTIVGDARALPFDAQTFDAVVTSPTYGNRLADSHNASDPETRRSYTHDLGRTLTDGNSGGMQWGDDYRNFHTKAWEETWRALRPGGLLIINIKDHIRAGVRQPVSAWHLQTCIDIGFRLRDIEAIPVQHFAAGSNAELRVPVEYALVLERGTLR